MEKKSTFLNFDNKEEAEKFIDDFNNRMKKLKEENESNYTEHFLKDQIFTGDEEILRKKNNLWNIIKYSALKYNCLQKQDYDLYYFIVENEVPVEINSKGEVLVIHKDLIEKKFGSVFSEKKNSKEVEIEEVNESKEQ